MENSVFNHSIILLDICHQEPKRAMKFHFSINFEFHWNTKVYNLICTSVRLLAIWQYVDNICVYFMFNTFLNRCHRRCRSILWSESSFSYSCSVVQTSVLSNPCCLFQRPKSLSHCSVPSASWPSSASLPRNVSLKDSFSIPSCLTMWPTYYASFCLLTFCSHWLLPAPFWCNHLCAFPPKGLTKSCGSICFRFWILFKKMVNWAN